MAQFIGGLLMAGFVVGIAYFIFYKVIIKNGEDSSKDD
jgi:hypothetical protein